MVIKGQIGIVLGWMGAENLVMEKRVTRDAKGRGEIGSETGKVTE